MPTSKLLDPDKVHSLEAEGAVLGSMILDPACISRVLPRLPRADSFYLPEHQTIYEAIVALFTDGRPIDGVTVRTQLKEMGKLEEIGGPGYLQEILKTVPTSANSVYYANTVREKETERRLRSAIEEAATVVDEGGSVAERIAKVQEIILELQTGRNAPDYVEVKNVVGQVAGEMFETEAEVVATGFREVDKLIQGFRPGEFGILAGRPSMGKSALMLSTALNMAKSGVPVLIFTLEMTPKALVERALCGLAGVDIMDVRSSEVGQDIREAICEQAFELRKCDIILSPVVQTPDQQRALIHRLKQTHDIGIAFVDYLQLMSTGRRVENRQQEVTTISRKLKTLAIQEDLPIVALSQLNRAVDGREDHRPRMSDLRESGSLEQDADLVLFLYRDDYYRKDEPDFEPSGITELIVSKNRRGPVGKASLVFVHDYCKFANLPEYFVGAR